MFVNFTSPAKRNDVMIHPDGTVSIFKWGKRRTADKKEIDNIMSSSRFNENDIKLDTPIADVADYLNGKEHDRFSDEYLDTVTDEGIIELAKVYKLSEREHGNAPVIIKKLLRGRYLNNEAHDVIAKNLKELTDEQVFDKLLEKGVVEYNKPWYGFTPEGAKEPTKTRDKEEVLSWINENKKKLLADVNSD